MQRERIGKFTINYLPELELATVTIQGVLAPEVVHEEDDPRALEKCKQWIAEQPTDELNGGTK